MWHLVKTPTPERLESISMRDWKRRQMFLLWWERWDRNHKSILNVLPQWRLKRLWCHQFPYLTCFRLTPFLCVSFANTFIWLYGGKNSQRSIFQSIWTVNYFNYSFVTWHIAINTLGSRFLAFWHLGNLFILSTKGRVLFHSSLGVRYTLRFVSSVLGTILWISSELLRSIGDGQQGHR